MEDYATYLAEEARSDIAALHQFRILYDDRHQAHHFFFEGEEDALFYMPVARRYTVAKDLHVYDCGGKKNVVEVRDALQADGYDLEKCLFFVDRDFDDFLNTQASLDAHTYITDGYSIENEISTMASAHIILNEIIGLTRADPDFLRIEAQILNGFDFFYRAILPLTAWIIAAKHSGCGPNLRNTTGLKGIVTFPDGVPTVTKKGFAEFKKKVVVNDRTPSFASVIGRRRELTGVSPKLWTRGKYDIWFFQTFLVTTLTEASIRRKIAGARALRIPTSLREGRLFELMGGRITPPESLQSFFQRKISGSH